MKNLPTIVEELHQVAAELREKLAAVEGAIAALASPEAGAAPPQRAPRAKPGRKRDAPKRAPVDGSAPRGAALADALAAVQAAGADGLSFVDLGQAIGRSPAHARMLALKLQERGEARVEGARRSRRVVAGATARRSRRTPSPLNSEAGDTDTDEEEPRLRSPVAAPKPTATPVAELRRTIKVEGITVREDRFKCLPMACTLTAGACVDRQATANGEAPIGARRQDLIDARANAKRFHMCKDCALGRSVVARLEAAA